MRADALTAASAAWPGRLIAWRHPEWWSLALSAGAAVALFATHSTGSAGVPLPVGGHHADSSAPVIATAAVAFWQWMLMVVAMMVPLSVSAIRTTAARSLWRRRHRAIAAFLVGFLAPWAIAGAALAIGIAAWTPADAWAVAVITALAFAVAMVWQRLTIARRALMACHGTRPLAPAGWAAMRDCVGFGASIGGHCVTSCWPLMLACAVSGHHPLVMIAAAAAGVTERMTPRRRQD